MWIVHTLGYTLIVIFDSIEFSSQFECLPDGAPIPVVRRHDRSSYAADTQHILAGPNSSTSSFSHSEPLLRSRSRSTSAGNRTSLTRLPPPDVLGYELDQLQFIRLVPYENLQRKFELRRYIFPTDKPVELLEGLNQYGPVPNREQIVLSTVDGDVSAILDGTDSLAGLYTYSRRRVRAKINMKNGKVTPLTADESKEIPVGRHRRILNGYRVEHLKHKDGSLAPTKLQLGSSSSPSSRYLALPTRLPSSDGTGYEIDQLHSIQLIPKKNRDKIFELRKYTFPMNEPILLYQGSNRYGPIPIQELIVLTTAGDIFAILETSNVLGGIYTYNNRTCNKERIKMNMRSEVVTLLTRHELGEVPVGRLRTILNNFIIQHVKHASPRYLIEWEGSFT